MEAICCRYCAYEHVFEDLSTPYLQILAPFHTQLIIICRFTTVIHSLFVFEKVVNMRSPCMNINSFLTKQDVITNSIISNKSLFFISLVL